MHVPQEGEDTGSESEKEHGSFEGTSVDGHIREQHGRAAMRVIKPERPDKASHESDADWRRDCRLDTYCSKGAVAGGRR